MSLESRCTSKCGAPCLRTLKSRCLYALGLCRIKSIRIIYNPKKKTPNKLNCHKWYMYVPWSTQYEKIRDIISFPIKKKREKKNTKKLHSMYSSATALQFSYQSQQIRKLIVLCKWNLRKTKKRKKGKERKQMGMYTFHESDVSRWVLHEQCFDPKPTFHTSVHIHIHIHLHLSLLFLLKATLTLTYWERVALGMEGLDTQFSVWR